MYAYYRFLKFTVFFSICFSLIPPKKNYFIFHHFPFFRWALISLSESMFHRTVYALTHLFGINWIGSLLKCDKIDAAACCIVTKHLAWFSYYSKARRLRWLSVHWSQAAWILNSLLIRGIDKKAIFLRILAVYFIVCWTIVQENVNSWRSFGHKQNDG